MPLVRDKGPSALRCHQLPPTSCLRSLTIAAIFRCCQGALVRNLPQVEFSADGNLLLVGSAMFVQVLETTKFTKILDLGQGGPCLRCLKAAPGATGGARGFFTALQCFS